MPAQMDPPMASGPRKRKPKVAEPAVDSAPPQPELAAPAAKPDSAPGVYPAFQAHPVVAPAVPWAAPHLLQRTEPAELVRALNRHLLASAPGTLSVELRGQQVVLTEYMQ